MHQEILERYPDLDIQVYCVWQPVLRQYSAEEMSQGLPKLLSRFADPRLLHYWDGSQTVGRTVKQQIIPTYEEGPVVWATFILFGYQGRWKDAHDHVMGWERPLIEEVELLKRLLQLKGQ